MELNQVKRIASKVLKVGISRVVVKKPEEAAQAMTREDVRKLVEKGAISKKPEKGTSRARARKIEEQKKKGRRRGPGSRKKTKKGTKEEWMKKVRALRKQLRELKPKLEPADYKRLYKMIKGGYFRSKSHLKLYVTERKLLKEEKA